MYVRDLRRWNRVKGWSAFACWIIAAGAVGFDDQSTNYQPRYDIALIALSMALGLMWSIYRKR